MDALGENSTVCNNTFTKDQRNEVLIAKGATGLLTLTMCLITVSFVCFLRLHKYFTYRLALYQISSSLCLGIVELSFLTLLNYDGHIYHYQIECKTTAFLLEYFVWIKLLFTLCLVFHLFCLAVCLKNFQKLEIGYVLFSILFPLLYTWIPFIHNSFGVAGAWCWIKDWKDDCATQKYLEGIIEQFVLWYIPLFISLTLSVVAVFIILIVLARRAYTHKSSENEYLIENHERNRNKKAIKEILPLLVYPVIFYFLILFPIINRVYSAISYKASFGLALAHSFTESSWGFFSSWALIIHILVMRQFKKKRRVQMMEQHTNNVNSVYDTGNDTSTAYSTFPTSTYPITAESDIHVDNTETEISQFESCA